jgi:phosphoglucomutase/phosphomannomutase
MNAAHLVERAEQAANADKLTPEAFENLKRWLEGEAYSAFWPEMETWIDEGQYERINDSFGAVLPFGTGGRRGRVGIGPNRINARTIGESAQGVANYILKGWRGDEPPSVAIASDTRNTSPEFTQLTAEVFAGNGLRVFLFDGPRPTPELSFAVRHLKAEFGIVISASHNPPSDNGFKVYGKDGAQIIAPVDAEIIGEVKNVTEIKQQDLKAAAVEGRLQWLGEELDQIYLEELTALQIVEEREAVDVVFSPLHGTGFLSVVPALERIGKDRVWVVEAQATPDGDFPSVAENRPNPEEPRAMELAIEEGKSRKADLVMATDPDADRLGVAVRKSLDGNDWVRLNGNQIGALLTYHILRELKERNQIPLGGVVVKTLVTTSLMEDICRSFGVEIRTDLLVGFKYIAEVINKDLRGHEERFIFGAEESHGYLRGTFVRDKDGAAAAVMMTELTGVLKGEVKTPHDLLEDIHRQYGYYLEQLESVVLEGEEGLRKIRAMMEGFRKDPPKEFGGSGIVCIEDYAEGRVFDPATGKTIREITKPKGNLLIFRLSEDGRNWLAVRPSGTEPKIKFYLSVHLPVDGGDLEKIKQDAAAKAKKIWDAVPRG